MAFVSEMAADFQAGRLTDWDAADRRTRAFFSSEMMARVEAIAPGWRRMASFANGVTLTHVMVVFVSLLSSPNFQQSTHFQQEILKWAVLFHDIAKVVVDGRGDRVHGFRSAAMTAAALPKIGFSISEGFEDALDKWFHLTTNAVVHLDNAPRAVQDNSQLPEIVAGIEHLFEPDTAATLIVKTVLLHMSLTVVSDYPNAAPLSDAEIAPFLDGHFFPLLKIMMLVDSDGWELFRPASRDRYRLEIAAVFDRLKPN